jgi:DNA polymerase III alpha subunit (gram-positive type)
VTEGNIFMAPTRPVDSRALDVQGRTEEQVRAFPPAREGLAQFNYELSRHIDKFDKKDKANPAAANGNFDLDFLRFLYESQGDKYFGSWQNWQLIDPIAMCRQLAWAGLISPLPNYKLGTLCSRFGIDLTEAHDALADTRAMRKLTLTLRDTFFTKGRG